MRPEDVPLDVAAAAAMALARHGVRLYDVEMLIAGSPGLIPPNALSAAIAAVYPLIRAAVIEECADVADGVVRNAHKTGHDDYTNGDLDGYHNAAMRAVLAGEIAAAIRALEDTP